MRIEEIEIDKIDTERKTEDRTGYDVYIGKFAEIRDSIEKVGLIQPIVVYEKDNGRYGLVIGRRRLAAFKQLKDKDPEKYAKIPAIITEGSTLSNGLKLYYENLARNNTEGTYKFYESLMALYAAYLGYEDDLHKNGVMAYKTYIGCLNKHYTKCTEEELDVSKKTRDFFIEYNIKQWKLETAYHIVQFPKRLKYLLADHLLTPKRAIQIHSFMKQGIDLEWLIEKIEERKIRPKEVDKELEKLKLQTKKAKTKSEALKNSYLIRAYTIEKEVKEFSKRLKKARKKDDIEKIIKEFKEQMLKEI